MGNMKKWIIAALVTTTLLSLILPGCSPTVNTYADPAQAINTTVNQEFIVALGSNPSTGYSWKPEYDNSTFTLVSHDYKSDDTTGKVVGAPGTDYFHFKATKAGSSQIKFKYYRPWETPKPDDKTANFNIEVK